MSALVFRSHSHLDLAWYHFIDVLTFELTRTVDRREALRDLMKHDRYQDAYEGTTGAGTGRHGPYIIERMKVDQFEMVSASEALADLDSWLVRMLDDDDDLALGSLTDTSTVIGEFIFRAVRQPFAEADVVCRLKVDEEAVDTNFPTPREHGFHEFACIDFKAARLNLIICTDD